MDEPNANRQNNSSTGHGYVKQIGKRFHCRWWENGAYCDRDYVREPTLVKHVEDKHLYENDAESHRWCNYCNRHRRDYYAVADHQSKAHGSFCRMDNVCNDCSERYREHAKHEKDCAALGALRPGNDVLPGRTWDNISKSFIYDTRSNCLVDPLLELPITLRRELALRSRTPDLPPPVPSSHFGPIIQYPRPTSLSPTINDRSRSGSSPHHYKGVLDPTPHSLPFDPTRHGITLAPLRIEEGQGEQDGRVWRSLAKGRANLSYRKAGIYGRAFD